MTRLTLPFTLLALLLAGMSSASPVERKGSKHPQPQHGNHPQANRLPQGNAHPHPNRTSKGSRRPKAQKHPQAKKQAKTKINKKSSSKHPKANKHRKPNRHPHPKPNRPFHPQPHPTPSAAALSTTTQAGPSATTYTSDGSVVVETPYPTVTRGGPTATTYTSDGSVVVESPYATVTEAGPKPTTFTSDGLIHVQTTISTAYSTTTYAGRTTKTVTTGSPSAPTVITELPCEDPKGLQWAYYTKQYVDPVYDTSANFQTEKPDLTGTTPKASYKIQDPAEDGSIYGTKADTRNFAVNLRSYLHAQEAGDYTFSLQNEDDQTRLWVGTAAYSGFDDDNVNIHAARANGVSGRGNYTVRAEEGQYIPVRLLQFNSGGATSLQLTVVKPDGTTISSNSKDEFVQNSCVPEDNAPAFKAYGNEQ